MDLQQLATCCTRIYPPIQGCNETNDLEQWRSTFDASKSNQQTPVLPSVQTCPGITKHDTGRRRSSLRRNLDSREFFWLGHRNGSERSHTNDQNQSFLFSYGRTHFGDHNAHAMILSKSKRSIGKEQKHRNYGRQTKSCPCDYVA